MPSRRQSSGRCVLAAHPGEHDPDLLFGRMLCAGRPPDLRTLSAGALCVGVSGSSPFLGAYDEPEALLNHLKPPTALTADRVAAGQYPLIDLVTSGIIFVGQKNKAQVGR